MTAERKKPELLAPAGDWEKLQMAVLYGADAVYLAGTSFGMRSFAGNFSDEELPRAVDFAHRHGVKVHATVNTGSAAANMSHSKNSTIIFGCTDNDMVFINEFL